MTGGQLAKDREEYAAWVAAQLLRIERYGENGFDVWDISKLRRAGVWREPADAFKGPWRTVKPYATQEFIWWIEAESQPRYTFTEWRARAQAERDRQQRSVVEWLESSTYCLSELEVLREMLARRDELIATARQRGAAWSDICTASGLSRMQAHTVAKQYQADQLPAVELRLIDGELVEVF